MSVTFPTPAGATDVEFQSQGATLRGWLFRATGPAPRPLVVMAHGWTAVKEMMLDRYAQAIAAAGLSVLVYDHIGFGGSGGEPRLEVDPLAQVRGYRDAITFAQALPDVDRAAIGVWGTSYSGGHVLTVAALDRRVACVVSQCPTISGWHNTTHRFSPDAWSALQGRLAEDRRARHEGGAPSMTPVMSDPTELERAPGRTHFGNNGPAWTANLPPERLAGWRNEITLRSLELYAEYEPGALIERIAPTPMMMILASRDTMTPTGEALKAFARAGDPKELIVLPGGHYDLYGDQMATAAEVSAEWFARHLLSEARASGGSRGGGE